MRPPDPYPPVPFEVKGGTVFANKAEWTYYHDRQHPQQEYFEVWVWRKAAAFCFAYALCITMRLLVPLYISRLEVKTDALMLMWTYMLVVLAVNVAPSVSKGSCMMPKYDDDSDKKRPTTVSYWGCVTPFFKLRPWWASNIVRIVQILGFIASYGYVYYTGENYFVPFLVDVAVSLFFFIWYRGPVVRRVMKEGLAAAVKAIF
jgi:hypothetical protein